LQQAYGAPGDALKMADNTEKVRVKSASKPENPAAKKDKNTDKPTKNTKPAAKSTKAKQTANKKPNIFVRMVRFVQSAWTELKKVHWPTREQLLTYSAVVLVIVVVLTVAVWLFDSLISFLIGLIL